MKIAIIDADLIKRKKHRFPNLVSMKISAYHKEIGDDVALITEYNDSIFKFDKVYLSKVFTDTEVPEWILELKNIQYGGTGFFYDKAPRLPDVIEHHRPDYHLYDEYVKNQILSGGGKENDFKYYKDYSIGFLTRGCFRKCKFCVNQNYDSVSLHSPLYEFLDDSRKKICLLDDNFFGNSKWKSLLLELQGTEKPFQFKQGLDERLITEEKCKMLFQSKYDGDFIFAFDNVDDSEIIEDKLKLIRQNTNKNLKFYVFCGFDRNDVWDDEFWEKDLWDLWKRIEILLKYKAYPYIMRFNRYKESPYAGHYITLARWCNQPQFLKQTSFREFSLLCKTKSEKIASSARYLQIIENNMPELASKYFDLKFIK